MARITEEVGERLRGRKVGIMGARWLVGKEETGKGQLCRCFFLGGHQAWKPGAVGRALASCRSL